MGMEKTIEELTTKAEEFVRAKGFNGIADHTLVKNWMAEFAVEYARDAVAEKDQFIAHISNRIDETNSVLNKAQRENIRMKKAIEAERAKVAELEKQNHDLLIQWSQEREKAVNALRKVSEVEAKSAALASELIEIYKIHASWYPSVTPCGKGIESVLNTHFGNDSWNTIKTKYDRKEKLEAAFKGKAPIVREHNGYIVLAQNDCDFQVKVSRINRGDVRGFFTVETVLQDLKGDSND